MKENFDFMKDGISIKNNFLNDEILFNIRKECEELFSRNQLYGMGYSIRLNDFVKEIPYPTAMIKTINLLEIAIDISKEIEALGFKNYKFAHLALYHETENPKELIWHSDLRNGGLIRAQICIDGGQLDSGAFKYLRGSQILDITDSYPTKEYLESNKDKIVFCNKPNGSLFLINTIGYHSKCICKKTRISFMFDFLPEDYILNNPNDVSSDIHLTSSRLSDKVVQNISLFRSGVNNNTCSVNTPDHYKFIKMFSGAKPIEIFKALFFYFNNKFLKRVLKLK